MKTFKNTSANFRFNEPFPQVLFAQGETIPTGSGWIEQQSADEIQAYSAMQLYTHDGTIYFGWDCNDKKDNTTRQQAIELANKHADETGREWVVTSDNTCHADYDVERNWKLVFDIVYSTFDRDELN